MPLLVLRAAANTLMLDEMTEELGEEGANIVFIEYGKP